jgi:hypothetical protein
VTDGEGGGREREATGRGNGEHGHGTWALDKAMKQVSWSGEGKSVKGKSNLTA